MCKVLVCGGRDFNDTKLLTKSLNQLKRELLIEVVIEGDGRGADRMAGYWARKNKLSNLKFEAKWDKDGKAAGFIRNLKMLDEEPDYVIAFEGGKGTQHTIDNALKRGIAVIKVTNKGLTLVTK